MLAPGAGLGEEVEVEMVVWVAGWGGVGWEVEAKGEEGLAADCCAVGRDGLGELGGKYRGQREVGGIWPGRCSRVCWKEACRE